MVSSLEPDMSLFRMHTPDSIQGTMDFLQRQESLGKDKFLELQTAMGFNFKPGQAGWLAGTCSIWASGHRVCDV